MTKRKILLALNLIFKKVVYYMAELVGVKKELSDWFPERSEFSYTDRLDGPLTKRSS